MKSLGVTFLLMVLAFAATAQNPADYFELTVEQYSEGDTDYVGVSPSIRSASFDSAGKFIAAHPRRFRYLLANNSRHFLYLENFHPDHARINREYARRMKSDRKFVRHFREMVAPAISKRFDRKKFSIGEIMTVASRFFFCDTVKPDRSIGSHICIALNGLADAGFDRDYTVVEAFCFESIFAEIEARSPARAKVVENFVSYINEISAGARKENAADDVYLKNVRGAVFKRMSQDTDLKKLLIDYFESNRNNLSFEISY